MFTDPQPESRMVLDAVSSLCTAIISSLKLGILRRCSFNVHVHCDVFNYFFKDNGSCVRHRPGKFYSCSDFCSNLFSDSNFIFVNKHRKCTCCFSHIYV